MLPIALAAVAAIVLISGGVFLYRRRRARLTYVQHSITPQALHAMLASGMPVELYDVRLPLDVLVDSQIIAGAKRVSPGEVRDNPALLPRDHDTIVYCTCPSDETSQRLVLQVRKAGYLQVRFLRGGLDAWRAAGFPVETYEDSFTLDSLA